MKQLIHLINKALPAIMCYALLSCGTGSGSGRPSTSGKTSMAQDPGHTCLDSIRFVTGACMGSCPVFTLALFAGDTAKFEGGAFCKRQGIYKAHLSNNSFERMVSFIDRNRIDASGEKYDNGAMDLPSATLYLHYRGRPAKMILDMQMQGTPPLVALYAQLQQIADTANWTKE